MLAVLFMVVVAAVFPVDAQQAKIHRVAVLLAFSTEEAQRYREAFFAGMRELGYIEGRNVVFDVRTSDRDRLNVPDLVMELIGLNPDVLVSDGNAIQAIRAKTTSIPVVLAVTGDPVREGFAYSLGRPGLNVTGSAIPFDALAAKHVEIMREIRPRLMRVAMLFDTTTDRCTPIEEGARAGAQQMGAALSSYRVGNREAIERAFTRMETDRPDLLLPCPAAMLFNNRDLLFDSALRLGIPLTSFVVANLPHGVLFSYAPSFAAGYRRAATYTDKILKGAKPGDLPIEQPTTFEFVINLKTARTLGITVPPSVLLRADKVIE
jgi:ABC-type uncharacterized transport system substrate-binding protein